MKHLPTVTLVTVTTKDYGPSIVSLQKSLEHITPSEVLYFSDIPYSEDLRIKHVQISPFRSVKDYNRFMVKELSKHIRTEHVLVVQHDGYVIDGSAWTDDFLAYDYIGAPWAYTDGRNVGNGGFSMRSKCLQDILATDPQIEMYSPEDEVICRYYRQYLEDKRGIRYAPENLAHRFSYEMHRPKCKTFGFHNSPYPPYREPVILKRTGAMGDLIMLEPAMEALYNKGYRVILDTQDQYFNLFMRHHFPVERLSDVAAQEDLSEARVINLDMSYETEPKELAIKTYYKYCGVPEAEPRNPRLNFRGEPRYRMFDKYIILHNDDTAMAHRNISGVNWEEVDRHIWGLGYILFRVGNGNGRGGIKINTPSENMLAYIISGANYFIGIDSGPSQIAVATGVKSMIFFGSVDPRCRYDRFENIRVMQHDCPIKKDGCYHEVISEVGQPCQADPELPPCMRWKTNEVIEALKTFIQ